MPTLNIEITAVTNVSNGKGTGTYAKTSGPGTVNPNGDIELVGQPATDIAWTITAAGYTFDTTGYSGAAIVQFGPPSNSADNKTCTIDDTNADLGFKYSLHLKDSDGNAVELDPRVINR